MLAWLLEYRDTAHVCVSLYLTFHFHKMKYFPNEISILSALVCPKENAKGMSLGRPTLFCK